MIAGTTLGAGRSVVTSAGWMVAGSLVSDGVKGPSPGSQIAHDQGRYHA
jgi:hypothetical protein